MQIDKLTLHFLGLYFVCSYIPKIHVSAPSMSIEQHSLCMQLIAFDYIAQLLHRLPYGI